MTPEKFSEVLDALFESMEARRRIADEERGGTAHGVEERRDERDETDDRLRKFLVTAVADVALRVQT